MLLARVSRNLTAEACYDRAVTAADRITDSGSSGAYSGAFDLFPGKKYVDPCFSPTYVLNPIRSEQDARIG